MRAPGKGSVTRRQDGRFWVRVSTATRRLSLGTYATLEEAESVMRGAVYELAGADVVPTKDTLASLEGPFFAHRSRRAGAHVAKERSAWATHVARAPFAAKPLRAVTQRDVQRWIEQLEETDTRDRRATRRLSRQTVKHAVGLVRRAFAFALREGLVDENPAHELELGADERTTDPWDFLRPHEQHALATSAEIPEAERLMMTFAFGTGLRMGEQWALRLEDLHVDGEHPEVVVRFGARDRPTKTRRIRRVPLFGIGLAAARSWLHHLPTYAPKNPHGLVFPSPRGHYRQGLTLRRPLVEGHQATEHEAWRHYLAAAGVVRPFRWYDLRHTFASSLVSGFWGRRWSLEEIKEVLGHTSIVMTQRYAHLADTAVRQAAAATSAPQLVTALVTRSAETSRATVDSNHWPSAPEAGRLTRDSATLEPPVTSLGTSSARELAVGVLEAIAAGAGGARELAVELVTAWLAAGASPSSSAPDAAQVLRGTTWAAAAVRLAGAIIDDAASASRSCA